jgi:hypothetical protein
VSDRPVHEDEIEVTPEMVEVGYRILVASGITDDPLEADRLLVEKIYCAMAGRKETLLLPSRS